MPAVIARWPLWYLAVVLYCLYLGFDAFRFFRRNLPHLRSARAQATTPRERGQVAGYRAKLLTPAAGWVLAGLGLLTGAQWIRILVAVAFLVSARSTFKDFVTGFAEGRKAAQLAAAPEYVRGRAHPTPAAYAAAVAYVGITRLLPMSVLVYAIRVI